YCRLFCQAEDGIRDRNVTGVQTCALPIYGFSSFVLTTTLGIGVILSAIPVALFQGTITLLASKIESIIPAALFDTILAEITAVGGLLILAIGLNLLKMTKIRVTNLLPSLIVVVVLLYFQTFM